MDKGCHQGKNNLASICRPVASGGAGEARAPHFLADHLTLSQPGGYIIPTQYYVPPPPRFSDLATALNYVIVKITVAH